MEKILFWAVLAGGYYVLFLPGIVRGLAAGRGGYFLGGEILIPVLVLVVVEIIRTVADFIKEIFKGE